MTLTEKILAKHSAKSRVLPGDNIWTDVDKLLTHDVCGPPAFGIFQREFGPNAQVWDSEKIILIPDHYIFTEDERANRNVDIIRSGPAQEYSYQSSCSKTHADLSLCDTPATPQFSADHNWLKSLLYHTTCIHE